MVVLTWKYILVMQCNARPFFLIALFYFSESLKTKLMSPNRQRSPLPSRVKKKLPYKADVLRQVTLFYRYNLSTVKCAEWVLLHNGGFCNNCTPKQRHYKILFSHNGYTWKVWIFLKITALCSVWKTQILDNIILTQNYAWHITQSDLDNYLVLATIKEQHHSVTCTV